MKKIIKLLQLVSGFLLFILLSPVIVFLCVRDFDEIAFDLPETRKFLLLLIVSFAIFLYISGSLLC